MKNTTMWVASTIAECRQHRRQLHGTVALVPTMGALHAGHISLVERGAAVADHVIVSIFVNPTQFGPQEDFSRYPRPLENDLALCQEAGVTGVFVPGVGEMYPQAPEAGECVVDTPAVAAELEGAMRPGHFRGVCRVVAKLFHIVEPAVACFGMKDYQQLQVVRTMTEDLFFPLRIEACPTRRESDGLAMSSRNMYLTKEQRPRATALYEALQLAREMVEQRGVEEAAPVEEALSAKLRSVGLEVDYAVLRHPRTLARLERGTLQRGAVALLAARWPNIRLIDNMVMGTAANA